MLRELGSQRPSVFEILDTVHKLRGTKSPFNYVSIIQIIWLILSDRFHLETPCTTAVLITSAGSLAHHNGLYGHHSFRAFTCACTYIPICEGSARCTEYLGTYRANASWSTASPTRISINLIGATAYERSGEVQPRVECDENICCFRKAG